ncbi:MAG: PQQ-binding-like beta-propeller repeat protein, partial [Bacteroidales bacterium]|nr:PQQ-binding-like beta-propeller repeat protein [Bacteroidales bacterium]
SPVNLWTHFRGNKLNGISEERDLPLTWNDSTHIAWKTPIEGHGWSSPVVYGDQVWLTTATEGSKKLWAVCISFSTGEIVHNRLLFTPDSLYRKHSVNTYATPTPAIEGGFVYIHFGRYGTACLDTETGNRVWERTDLKCTDIQGPGSSLLVYKDKLIVHMEGSDIQYIIALDKKTGGTLWRTERPKELYDQLGYIGKKAYITPIIVNVEGKDLMISNGSAACIAYDPETGSEVWRIVQGEDSTIAMPTEGDGMVYFYTGETNDSGKRYAELLAVDPRGTGDIERTHVLWRLKTPTLQLLTPVVVDGLLYTVDTRGIMHCMEASSGETVWSKKMKGKFHSSPVHADGHIYFSSERGTTHVISAGREMDFVAQNSLEGEIWATPAVTGGAIIMRTSEFLYKITGK